MTCAILTISRYYVLTISIVCYAYSFPCCGIEDLLFLAPRRKKRRVMSLTALCLYLFLAPYRSDLSGFLFTFKYLGFLEMVLSSSAVLRASVLLLCFGGYLIINAWPTSVLNFPSFFNTFFIRSSPSSSKTTPPHQCHSNDKKILYQFLD